MYDPGGSDQANMEKDVTNPSRCLCYKRGSRMVGSISSWCEEHDKRSAVIKDSSSPTMQ